MLPWALTREKLMQKISLLFYCLSVFALQNSFAQHPPRFDTEEIQVNPACTSEQMQDISSSSKANFILPCIPVFNAQNKQQRIKTRLVFEGAEFSNMVLNCQGSTLVKGLIIRSRLNETNSKNNSNWSVPRNITIENCKTEGMMHVHGVARNGEGEHLTQSSRLAGHTERTQAQSPSEIHFRYIESNSSRAIPFYFGPGVTESSIKYSNIAGHSGSVAIYFDAETAYNQISHNRISTKTSNRELIAIDGSAHNLITDNHFSSLKNGGIYLYRNCGEGGNIRHQTPQYLLDLETGNMAGITEWQPQLLPFG